MIFGRCKNCNTFIGAYSPIKQVVRCPKCDSLIGFKSLPIRQSFLFVSMLLVLLFITNIEYSSAINFYLTATPTFWGFYILSMFTFKLCESFDSKVKEFKLGLFVISNIVNAIVSSVAFTTALVLYGNVSIG